MSAETSRIATGSPDPRTVHYEFRDEFGRELFKQAILLSLRDRRSGAKLYHLARGYEAGVEADEILERIACGELERGDR